MQEDCQKEYAGNQDMCVNRPNIVIIMADDMGYSDIGCFGSEVESWEMLNPRFQALYGGGLK